MEPSPATNVIVIPGPPLALPPVPIANEAAMEAPASLPQTAAVPGGLAKLESREFPVVSDGYPPLVVLKTGGMYSITKYWVKNKNIYFETTAGDVLYAPRTDLDRIIPGSKR
jgi:hypothetical protein